MNPSETAQQRGWALPATLCALAIMLSVMRVISLESTDTSLIASEIRSADELHKTIATTISDARPSSGRCDRVQVPHDRGELSYEVCGESFRPLSAVPASVSLPQLLVDYDSLFASASDCPSTPKPTTFRALSSPFAALDCYLTGDTRGSLTVLDNILGESIALRQTGTGPLMLATPGRIVISLELRPSHDLVVLAGGDVQITAIRSASQAPVKVTVLSSLGEISIGSVEGEISLLAAGRGELNVPRTEPSRDYPLPPLRPPSVFGFRSVS